MGIRPCDGEIRGGWFYWVLRDAVARAGYYQNPETSGRFYRRMAEEIDGACDHGSIPCLPPRATLMPVFQWEQIPRTARTFWKALAYFPGVDAPEIVPQFSQGLPQQYRLFRLMLAGKIDPPAGEPAPPDPAQAFAAAALNRIAAVYRWITPLASTAALACFLLSCRRGPTFPACVNLVVLTLILSRLLLLSYMDAASWPVVNAQYLSPAYPLLFLFCGVALADALIPRS